jgi:regulator of protease activity HflC (stomatin/prohibitin superfamily)
MTLWISKAVQSEREAHYESRIKELENIICPVEQHDYVMASEEMHMQEDLIQFGINASGIAIEDIDFTDAFTAAVETKQVATQEKLTAQTEQEKLTMQAKAEAERQSIAAKAEAEKAKIAADAEAYAIQTKAAAEAEANQMIADSLTDELIDYTQVQGWDGQLPAIYSGGGEMIPILNIDGEGIER